MDLGLCERFVIEDKIMLPMWEFRFCLYPERPFYNFFMGPKIYFFM